MTVKELIKELEKAKHPDWDVTVLVRGNDVSILEVEVVTTGDWGMVSLVTEEPE